MDNPGLPGARAFSSAGEQSAQLHTKAAPAGGMGWAGLGTRAENAGTGVWTALRAGREQSWGRTRLQELCDLGEVTVSL